MLRGTAREAAAEFLGTFILIVFGVGVGAQVVLSGQQNGNYLSINLAWGLAVTMGIYVAGGVSGAHLNPAVTLAMAVFRRFPWRKLPIFWLAQVGGAFVASAVVYLTYREGFDQFDHGVRQVVGPQATAGIFATYPQAFLSVFPGAFLDQTIGTALLMLLIFAISDQRNQGDDKVAPILVGGAVTVIGMSFGFNAGYAINPARDFGPRLFTYFAGWGSEVFRTHHAFWWVPIVAPCLGALLGGLCYETCIARHHPELD